MNRRSHGRHRRGGTRLGSRRGPRTCGRRGSTPRTPTGRDARPEGRTASSSRFAGPSGFGFSARPATLGSRRSSVVVRRRERPLRLAVRAFPRLAVRPARVPPRLSRRERGEERARGDGVVAAAPTHLAKERRRRVSRRNARIDRPHPVRPSDISRREKSPPARVRRERTTRQGRVVRRENLDVHAGGSTITRGVVRPNARERAPAPKSRRRVQARRARQKRSTVRASVEPRPDRGDALGVPDESLCFDRYGKEVRLAPHDAAFLLDREPRHVAVVVRDEKHRSFRTNARRSSVPRAPPLVLAPHVRRPAPRSFLAALIFLLLAQVLAQLRAAVRVPDGDPALERRGEDDGRSVDDPDGGGDDGRPPRRRGRVAGSRRRRWVWGLGEHAEEERGGFGRVASASVARRRRRSRTGGRRRRLARGLATVRIPPAARLRRALDARLERGSAVAPVVSRRVRALDVRRATRPRLELRERGVERAGEAVEARLASAAIGMRVAREPAVRATHIARASRVDRGTPSTAKGSIREAARNGTAGGVRADRADAGARPRVWAPSRPRIERFRREGSGGTTCRRRPPPHETEHSIRATTFWHFPRKSLHTFAPAPPARCAARGPRRDRVSVVPALGPADRGAVGSSPPPPRPRPRGSGRRRCRHPRHHDRRAPPRLPHVPVPAPVPAPVPPRPPPWSRAFPAETPSGSRRTRSAARACVGTRSRSTRRTRSCRRTRSSFP